MFLNKLSIYFTLLVVALCARAEEKTTSLIFEGASSESLVVNLEDYNRIIIEEESMRLISNKPQNEDMEILYSAYNKFSLGNENDMGYVPELPAADNRIVYNSVDQTLMLNGNMEETYRVGVFTSDGVLILSAGLTGGESLPVHSLDSGAYIAVAVADGTSHAIKFVK